MTRKTRIWSEYVRQKRGHIDGAHRSGSETGEEISKGRPSGKSRGVSGGAVGPVSQGKGVRITKGETLG